MYSKYKIPDFKDLVGIKKNSKNLISDLILIPAEMVAL